MSARTLVVWCPDWPITAARVPAGVPAAVVHANRVEACSPEARDLGLRPGLRRRQAQGRCPGLMVLERRPGQETAYFETTVVKAVERFSPRVEVRDPGECAFPSLGPSRYFGGDESLAQKVALGVARALDRERVHSFGLVGRGWRVGVADGPFAARMAARTGVVVPPGGSADFLALFPVTALERPDMADLLNRLGIRTLSELAALPEEAVSDRFGVEGQLCHRLARGLDERVLELRSPDADLVVSLELDPPAERVDSAAFSARALSNELFDRLDHVGLYCTRVRVETETEHGEHLSRLWSHDGPFTPGELAERVRWQLEGWLTGRFSSDGRGARGTSVVRPTAGLVVLRLVPEELTPHGMGQSGFWGEVGEMRERASRALARVQGLLGQGGVVTPALVGGRGPADRVCLTPWGDPRPQLATESWPWPGRIPAPSPAIVHPEPLEARLVDGDGDSLGVNGRGVSTGRPFRLSVEGGPWLEVVNWAGPWPSTEHWWDRSSRRRRARIQVIVQGGTAYLLSLENSEWGVEACYD